MHTPFIRSVQLVSIVSVLALAGCEKEQTTPPTDGDAPVGDAPAGDAAGEEPAEEPKEGGW
jgi:hypothetical protein